MLTARCSKTTKLKNDRLYDSKRNYIGLILKIDLETNLVVIQYGIFEYNIDINKLD